MNAFEPKKIIPSILLIILFVLITLGALYLGFNVGNIYADKYIQQYKMANNTDNDKINLILQYIRDNYVDSINPTELQNDAIKAILHQLDPHSDFIPPQDFTEVQEQMQGNFQGIGIEFSIIRDTITIMQVIKNSPSEKAGLMVGDKIITINDTTVAGKKITNEQVIKKIRGKKNTYVKLNIQRQGLSKPITVNIQRDEIPLYSIDTYYMLDKNIGYIKIDRFAQNTPEEFETAMKSLLKKGMKKLILDLRDNPGGLLDAAVKIADQFLPEGTPIVYTQGRKYPKKTYTATSNGLFENQPIVILIDEGSASASEILAGAIQDNDRGEIIGRRSFGKGLVQEELDMPDGSAIRLTIAKYYTPTGRCIQKPYNKKNMEDYHLEEYTRYINGEILKLDSTKIDTSKKYITPKGKILYGGGGIIPDIFVPADTSIHYARLNTFITSGCLRDFVLNKSEKEKNDIQKKYPKPSDFIKNYNINNTTLSELIKICKDTTLLQSLNNKELQKLKLMIKANIAKLIYNNNAYYETLNTDDKTILQAIQYLQTLP